MGSKPNVIILGGVNTCSRALAALLVPLEGEPLVGHLRIVDKFSVAPPTTYIGSEFPKILEKPNVEYRQANLTVAAAVATAFDPPEGQAPYEYVFDLTGETRHDRPEGVQLMHTFNISRLVGLEAAKRKVKAYVRLQHPFYESSEKGSHEEKEDVKPDGIRGIWWHETLRMLAAIEGLNLVVLRIGYVYGPYTDFGRICTFITVAAVYGYMKKPMKALHPPGKHPTNTVHVDDVAGGLWAAALWIAGIGRKEADVIAGEELRFHNEKSKVNDVDGMLPHDAKAIAPLFNLVDDNETTLLKAGQTATAFFGTTFDFYNFVMNTMAKFRLEDVVEEINEHHVGGWTEMIQKSDPPITNTPLTGYMSTDDLQKHVVAYSNAKFKKVVGYTVKHPHMGPPELSDMIDKWKADHVWPNVPQQ
ncbi:hypothetical protein PUNSTDRAFT_144252 [Punctularia strigosozonata HHB-11173 SS5]|uniref:uncharacterized protein n=1 Tax=Punctularia strigosozonata (strain HHB-11173) TaxID=741275 RepID=UPI0004416A3F|nr:uncharacterized protein PUNSTDRAFT_144252 [Punctularia strigosozonata HHB-11173 SS5]EIN07681.1 hypothetical protein PUNSTDRAFT_144252 [Punctularia strigosozonata HHB-11173 SS5]